MSDATTLLPAVRKALRVVDAVPQMEAFISDVCEAVYRRGAAFVPPHLDGTKDPRKVRWPSSYLRHGYCYRLMERTRAPWLLHGRHRAC